MTKPISLNCDTTQKLIVWNKLKYKIVTKLKNLNSNKTKKLELGQNSTWSLTNFKNSNCYKYLTQIVTKLNSSNWDKTQKLKFWKQFFVKNNLTPQQLMRCIWGSHLISCYFLMTSRPQNFWIPLNPPKSFFLMLFFWCLP